MNMNKTKTITRIVLLSLGLCFVFAFVSAAAEQPVVLTLTGESVVGDTCQCTIEATGIGEAQTGRSPAQAKLLAERAAKLRAYRNLLHAVRKTRPILTEEATVIHASGFLQGARILEKRYLPDGKVIVKMTMDVSYVPSDHEPCKSYLISHTKQMGYPVYVVNRSMEEISEEEWKTWNP